MSLRTVALALGAAIALALPGNALASNTTAWVNLRVGPSLDNYVLTVVPPGVPVDIHGCVPGWCQVWSSSQRAMSNSCGAESPDLCGYRGCALGVRVAYDLQGGAGDLCG